MCPLKTCLWIVGVGCLLAVFGLFLPLSVIESLAKVFGDQAFPPDSPVFAYALRGLSATYVAVGVFYVILALNPMKYGLLVPFSGAAGIFVGLACAVCGPLTEVPPLWFLGDFLFCTVFGILILAFWRRALTAERKSGIRESGESQ